MLYAIRYTLYSPERSTAVLRRAPHAPLVRTTYYVPRTTYYVVLSTYLCARPVPRLDHDPDLPIESPEREIAPARVISRREIAQLGREIVHARAQRLGDIGEI